MKCLSILYQLLILNALHLKYVLCSFGNGLVKANWGGVTLSAMFSLQGVVQQTPRKGSNRIQQNNPNPKKNKSDLN